MMLFVSILSETLGVTLTEASVQAAAKLTFINVLFLSLIFTLFDVFRRKIMVDKPVRRITAAAKKIIQGDFDVRINRVSGFAGTGGFNEIIDCFNKMTEELSGIETLRTDFISNVSHELKTPLAVMQNYSTMLQQPGLDEAKRIEYAKSISGACRRLASLISNILKLNKLENQQIYPSVREYDLGEQLCECLLQFEDAWEKKKMNIETDIEDDVIISSDSELLSHVWNNLFSNAIKFTDKGGTVLVSLKATPHHIVVKVSDTGCGMTPEVGKRIFDKFYQGDTSHGAEGNGLGLALVKRVVDIMQGEIGVESVCGQGSTFTVRFRRG
ncbi:MAG: HAMP domain-containing histidine kinase [Clostridia bacterium]|nr:HAMP domain-containing histidine kinase [Clostridia bacterium]